MKPIKNIVEDFDDFYEFDDIFIDISELYYFDGKLIPKDNFEHPENGIFRAYMENKKLLLEIEYKNNKKNGFAKCYYEDTNILEWVNCYKNDKLNGICQAFYEDGTLKTIETFKNGTKNGIENIYNVAGILIKSNTYRNNHLISENLDITTPEEIKIYVDNDKIGVKNIKNDKILIPAIYDYDDAVKGSYYSDPDYHDNYFLYHFREHIAIFKLGNKVCVYNDKGELIEPLTTNIENIVQKYYYGLSEYFKEHAF